MEISTWRELTAHFELNVYSIEAIADQEEGGGNGWQNLCPF